MEYKEYLIDKLTNLENEYDTFQKNRTFVMSGISIVVTIASKPLTNVFTYVLIMSTLIYIVVCSRIEFPLFEISSKEDFNNVKKLEEFTKKFSREISEAYEHFSNITTLYVIIIMLIFSLSFISN